MDDLKKIFGDEYPQAVMAGVVGAGKTRICQRGQHYIAIAHTATFFAS
jgi:hypothetical protein